MQIPNTLHTHTHEYSHACMCVFFVARVVCAHVAAADCDSRRAAKTSNKKRVRREREWVRESEASNCQVCVSVPVSICVCVSECLLCICANIRCCCCPQLLLTETATATEWVNESRLCCLLAKSAASFFVKACIRSYIHTYVKSAFRSSSSCCCSLF